MLAHYTWLYTIWLQNSMLLFTYTSLPVVKILFIIIMNPFRNKKRNIQYSKNNLFGI